MRIKLDENLPESSAALLRDLDHDVDTVANEGMTGAPDDEVLAAATTEGRLLITLDRGFADIRRHPPGTHAGIVVLRPVEQLAATVTAELLALVSVHALNDWTGCNVVVRQGVARIRLP